MIWFACKQCNKVHGRPENTAGALVFCDCGHGNFVPWESTAAAPEVEVVALPATPELAPVTFEPAAEPEPAVEEPEPRPRRGRAEKRDPDKCFNHQEVPNVAHCADCDEGFCADCLVTLQGATLCGPCKNFRARRLELGPQSSSLASASLILAFLTSPLAVCQFGWNPSSSMPWLAFVAFVPQLLALGLGVWALWLGEKDGRSGGQALALSGVVTAALMCLMTGLLYVSMARQLL
jgi:hypothetical protein